MRKHPGIYRIKTKNGYRYQAKWRRLDGTQAAKNFRTITEAVKFKRMAEHEKSRGHLPDDRLAKVKFGEFAQTRVFPGLRHCATTLRRRNGIMRKHLLPALGNKPISKILRADILQLVTKWHDEGLSSRTITNHLNVLRPVFREAVLQDIIARNPMDGIKAPKADEVRRYPLTPEQCRALLEAIDPRYAYAVHFVLATGVRWSEFENLKMSDFQGFRNMVVVTSSKTAAGVRELPLDRQDIVRISRHITETGRQGAAPDSPLFTSPDGSRLHYSNFRRRVFVPACKKAGLVGVTFHDLRRTHATMLVAEGHDPKVVQERMGHRSISTTLTFYAQATAEGKAKAAGAKSRYLKADIANADSTDIQDSK
jgi:integrase